jgi:hypothetical protein
VDRISAVTGDRVFMDEAQHFTGFFFASARAERLMPALRTSAGQQNREENPVIPSVFREVCPEPWFRLEQSPK